MKDFSLAEALRYITAGFVFFGELFWLMPDKAVALAGLGEVALLGFSLAFGAVLYPVYRGLVYNAAIPPLQDWFQTIRARETYRTWLRNMFKCSGKDATILFVAVRGADEKMLESHRSADATIANVHLGYTTAVITMAFVPAAIRWGTHLDWIKLLVLAIVVFLGTFFFEQRFQADELMRLKLVEQDTLDELATKLGFKRVASQATAADRAQVSD